MRYRTPALVTAALVVGVSVSPGSAVAAAAKSVLLGRSNSTTATTTITNTKGTPLALNAKKGTAPLRVNSSTKVAYLNADRLDGLSSESFLPKTAKAADAEKVDGINGASLALTTGRTGLIFGSATDPDGFVNTAVCPAGTVATGGGGASLGDGSLTYSGPDFNDTSGALTPNSWFTDSSDATVIAWVTCYSPRGGVPGATTNFPTALKAAKAQAKLAGTHKKLAR